jgi:hypothetical protein
MTVKSFSLILLSFICYVSTYAQSNVTKDTLRSKRYFIMGTELAFFRGLTFSDLEGVGIIKSYPLPSSIVNFGYRSVNDNNWIFQTKISFGFSPVNLTYKTIDLENHTILNSDGSQYDLVVDEFQTHYVGSAFFSIDASVYKQRELKNKRMLFYGGGMGLYKGLRMMSEGSLPSIEIIPDDSYSYTLFAATNDVDTNRLSWKPSVFAQLGIGLKNNFSFSLVVSYSFVDWFSGYYSFYHLGFPSSGRYSKDFSYAGIQMVYAIPLKRIELNKNRHNQKNE